MLEQEPVANTGRADGLASATTETSIDVKCERGIARFEATLSDGAHQVDSTARRVVLIAEQLVGGTRGQAEAAVYTGEDIVELRRQRPMVCARCRHRR